MSASARALREATLARILAREPLRREGETLVFDEPPAATPAGRSLCDALRERAKGLGSLYPRLIALFSPVLPSRAYKRALADALARHPAGASVVNVGSGPGRAIRDDVVNCDRFPHPDVDLAVDAARLPLRDGSVDLCLSVAVLEHVPDPAAMVAEMVRVVRPGGEIFCFVPFLQPFHAAPDDFSRRTLPGLLALFPNLTVLDAGLGAGPASALLWTGQHVLAMLLSCGSARVYGWLLTACYALFWPLKYLDLLLDRHPGAGDAASGFFVVAKKPETLS